MSINILITGGSSGIGKATANLLKKKGHNVIITGRDPVKLKQVAEFIGCDYFSADQSKEEEVNNLYSYVLDRFSSVDVIINNASVGSSREPIENIHLSDFWDVFSINVFGIFNITQKFINILKTQKAGIVINVGSTCTFDGYEGGSVYVSSKCALEGLSKCWRYELSKYNIKVTHIIPGNVSTAWGNNLRVEETLNEKKLDPVNIGELIANILEFDQNVIIPEVIISPLATYQENTPLFD